MSRHQTFHFRGEREGRVAQMSRQEEVIAKKRQELLEKQKTSELAKQVVAAQLQPPIAQTVPKDVKHPSNLPKQTFEAEPPAPKNNFTNDGSFFENFRKITEAAKKAEEEKQKLEAARLAKEQEQQKIESGESVEHTHQALPQPIPPLDSAFSTNSMSLGPPPPPINFHQTIPPFLNLAAPPPPPPPPVVSESNVIRNIAEPNINVMIPQQPPPPPPPQFVQQAQGQHPPHMQQNSSPFEGNNYLNENQMSRNIEQMERNNVNTHQQMNNPLPLNSDLNPSINIAATIPTNIPTNIDDLIEYIAKNGDNCEEKIIAEIAQMNERSLFRFLNDKDSDNYKMYRQKVLNYRAEKLGQPSSSQPDNNEKYDPEDILRDDEPEVETNPIKLMNIPSLSNSDDYDSDSEYMQETMERNLKNMKHRIVSGNTKKRYAESSTYSSDEGDHTDEEDHMEMYRKIQMRENAISEPNDSTKMDTNDFSNFQHQQENATNFDQMQDNAKKAKRSRWGEKIETNSPQQTQTPSSSNAQNRGNKPMLSAVKRTDPALLNYARQNYGTTDLTEEDWAKCEEHFKVNLLYQDMLRKREELDRMAKSGQHKYEYDSDEDVEGGTWEHKMREAEMEATAAWADALNRQSEGKHHIGDFLPPEELKKFMEIYKSKQTNREPDLSDYKEYKLKEDNKGFQMLQKLGWTEGQGLGVDGGGIVNPVNKATQRDSNQGLGTASNTTPEAGDNEYDAYRKRMMLAYRFRPNPLNNPRRAYY